MPHEAQFLFPTCRAADLDVRAVLRRTHRTGSRFDAAKELSPVRVGLSVHRGGEEIFDAPDFGTIAPGAELVLDAASVPALGDGSDQESLVVARCSLEGGEGYFPQEHQLTYSGHGRRTHLLYDQLPIAKPDAPKAPIVLLAPKAWVCRDVNTLVAFASRGGKGEHDLDVSILDPFGSILHQETLRSPATGVMMYDVRARLAASIGCCDSPRFVNVVARGGAAQFAILTFVVNEVTGACALEHSLSPHYYTQSGRDRLRREALMFRGAS